MTSKVFTAALLLLAKITLAQDTDVHISDSLELKRLTAYTWLFTSYKDILNCQHCPANGLVFMNNGKAYIVNPPWDDKHTEELVTYLEKEIKLKVAGVIATHRHDDTMGGLNFMHQHGVSSYALELTRDIAKSENLPLPQHTFKDSLHLNLDDKPIICRYFGGGHTSDNIVVWIPGDKILFGGCLIRSAGANNLGNTTDADLNAWPETVKKLLTTYKDCKIVVPGHGGSGDFSLIEHTLEVLESNEAQ